MTSVKMQVIFTFDYSSLRKARGKSKDEIIFGVGQEHITGRAVCFLVSRDTVPFCECPV